MSTGLCPKIYNSTLPTNIVTVNTINLVRPSKTDRTVGTTVTVSCYSQRTLRDSVTNRELTTTADITYTCINDGPVARWDKPLPYCDDSVPTEPSGLGLSQEELIVIGVVAAICALVLVMVIVMLCACWYKRRRDRTVHKRPVSEFSVNTGEFDRYKPYSAYSPFPGLYRDSQPERRSQPFYTSSLPRSALPESFPRSSHSNAYEMASHSAIIRTRPSTNYAGPRIYRASSDTYEDYLAEKNANYNLYPVGRDNEGFRGEWTDRFDRKNLTEFNSNALQHGRDPFLWDRNN